MGNYVVIRLWDWELSERFLGSKCDLTLLEADATLVRFYATGIDRDRVGRQRQRRTHVE